MTAENQLDDIVHTLGVYDITPEEAMGDENFRVLELPKDLVEHYLTKTFTPDRYAKICRDVAYFSTKIGSAPRKGMGDGPGDPGSGMRRAREGALYNLANRKPLLQNAVDLGFISIVDGGFEDTEDPVRFTLEPRGAWFLNHFYGDHIPVRKVERVKLSRHSTALNVKKVVVDASKEPSIKSVEEWREQADKHNADLGGDADTGLYHTGVEPVDGPGSDPMNMSLVKWIDPIVEPDQFNISTIDGQVHLTVDLEDYVDFDSYSDPNTVRIERDEETGDLWIREEQHDRLPVYVSESTGSGRIGLKGGYEALVESGGKDALKETTNASWNDDYETWYVSVEEFLKGVEAMLRDSDVEAVSAPARIIHEYTEYLHE